MQENSFRIINIAAGVLLIIAGIYCLCNQDVAVLSAGVLLGAFMLASGIIEVAVAARMCGGLLPFLFTLWLLFSGISRFVGALDLHVLGVRGWGWVLALGILLMAAGFVCMMDPWVSVAAIGVTVGIVFLLEGVSCIVYACIAKTKDA